MGVSPSMLINSEVAGCNRCVSFRFMQVIPPSRNLELNQIQLSVLSLSLESRIPWRLHRKTIFEAEEKFQCVVERSDKWNRNKIERMITLYSWCLGCAIHAMYFSVANAQNTSMVSVTDIMDYCNQSYWLDEFHNSTTNITCPQNLMQVNRSRTIVICPNFNRAWHTYFKLVFVPAIVLFGIAGNILSFIVMSRPSYKTKPYSCYLRALAVCDSLTLLFTMLYMSDEICRELGHRSTCFLPNLFTTDILCKLVEFSRHVVYLMSSWLIVLFTIDRYLAVCHPLVRCISSQVRACALVLFVAFLAMVTQSFRLQFIQHMPNRNQPCHAPIETRMNYYAWHYFGFSVLLRFFLPCLIIAVCNGLIVYYITALRRSQRAREGMRVRNANLAITTLFVVCGVFVVGLLPNALISTILYVSRQRTIYCHLMQLDQPFQVLRLLNYGINCVLYGMTGRHFRCELHQLLTGKKRPANQGHRHIVRFTALHKPKQWG